MNDERLELVSVYLKGLAMGAADAVPGVSGGTIAMITGIYERLINAITYFNMEKSIELILSVASFDLEEISKSFRGMDGYFLVFLFSGILTSVVSVLRLMHFFLESFPVPTYGFFFGLIAASVVVLRQKVDLSNWDSRVSAFLGFLLAFFTSGYAATSLGHSNTVIFISGLIAVSAMVLPGISGSLILIILGQYKYISGSLTSFIDAILKYLQTGDINSIVSTSPPIIFFVTGALVGLFSIANLIKKALSTFRRPTMAFLVSLIAGALRAPIVQVQKIIVENQTSWINISPGFILLAVIGIVFIFALDCKAGVV